MYQADLSSNFPSLFEPIGSLARDLYEQKLETFLDAIMFSAIHAAF